MKKITIMSFVALLCSFIYGTAFAENGPGQGSGAPSIYITMHNGRHNTDGSVTYEQTSCKYDSKKNTLTVHCFNPGSSKCPVEVNISVTTLPGDVTKPIEPVMGAINKIKQYIAKGQPKGKLVYDDMLYTWDNGVLLENGTFEMSLKSVEYNKVLP